MDYEALSKEYVLHAVQRPVSLILERAEGARMWDINGKLYLDTMSGSAGPAMVGHAHPAVTQAVSRQLAKLPSVNLLHESPTVIEFCSKLASVAPQGMTKTFLCTGGGEAVEAAEIVIEGHEPIVVLRAEPMRGRLVSECIELAKAHEEETGKTPVLGPDFAADVEEIVKNRKPWNPPAWE